MIPKKSFFISLFFILLINIILGSWSRGFSYPIQIEDSSGRQIHIEKEPQRVVSLVPSVTEIILALNKGDVLKGITYHSTSLYRTSGIALMGGFLSPDIKRIAQIEPDVIFYSDLQKKIPEKFKNSRTRLILLDTMSLSNGLQNIRMIGEILDAQGPSEKIIKGIEDRLSLIGKKVAIIPQDLRKRVIRIMGINDGVVMVPGDDSFQNEIIMAAGGIPPVLNKKGDIVTISREEWIQFNPQVIYGCGGYTHSVTDSFKKSGWGEVEAIRKNKIFDFPCDLTCRAATHTGYFVEWLSARIYSDEFSRPDSQVTKDRVAGSRHLDVALNYVKDARITDSFIKDFTNKTLIIDFKRPLSVISTLEGYRTGVETVMNHYSSPPGWIVNHHLDIPVLKRLILSVIGKREEKSVSLFTGADMDCLSIKKVRYREMEVYALVTAGVRSNALRMSRDEGLYYEPGTINIILLPNMHLSSRAMTRAIISATEAKTAALMDMDIRSSYTPMIHQATGTGTDNIILVEGEGIKIDNSGGHTKMGELIAKAVYEGVKEAVHKQNGITGGRDIFQRLMDRKLDIAWFMSLENCNCGITKSRLAKAFERLLLDPFYGSFLKASFAINDDYEQELIGNLEAHDLWCREIAEGIAGHEIEEMRIFIEDEGVPVVLRMSLNALLNGIYYKEMN